MIVLILQMLLKEYRHHFALSLADQYPRSEIDNFFRRLTHFYFNWDPSFPVLEPNHRLSNIELDQLNEALEALKKYQPLQYILKEAYFYGSNFYVDSHVLIPRPETEELVEWVLRDHPKIHMEDFNVLEIGTGSGCIAVSLAKAQAGFRVAALDVSKAALEVAQKNAELHQAKVDFFHLDMTTLNSWKKPLDIVISNPPYVHPEERTEMSANVLDYEPHLALFTPEKDPLYFYRKIMTFAQKSLKIGGLVYLEINPKFQQTLELLINEYSFKDIEVRSDIFGKNRMLKAVKL